MGGRRRVDRPWSGEAGEEARRLEQFEPQRRGEAQRDGDGEVADKTVGAGLHAVMGIKTRATRVTARKLFAINDLRIRQGRGCQRAWRSAMPGWRETAKMAVHACSVVLR